MKYYTLKVIFFNDGDEDSTIYLVDNGSLYFLETNYKWYPSIFTSLKQAEKSYKKVGRSNATIEPLEGKELDKILKDITIHELSL